MKTSIPSRRAQRGTILLICLFSAALIGIALASYLTLAQQEYVTTYRSHIPAAPELSNWPEQCQ
jgi:hypothetical protein